ncbi:MAG: radical SAM protein [bacterium]|nr:radical SAM protein [bacterium]
MHIRHIKYFPTTVLLIVPALDNDPFMGSAPNLGLGYVGAAMKKAGHKVILLDLALYRNDLRQVTIYLEKYHPEVVGITGFSFHYHQMLQIVRLIRKKDQDIVTVLGGSHASALAEFIIQQENNVDYVIRGEGEIAFPALLEKLYHNGDFSSVPGLVYRDDTAVKTNTVQSIDHLDNLSYPWEILNPLDYQSGKVHGFICRKLPLVPVLSSRGCPYQCTFCAGRMVLGSKIRMRSPEAFIRELVFLKETFGMKEFQIVDDNFTFYREHAAAVCRLILESKLDMSWSLPNGIRADRLDEELLQLMKKAGCYYMAFGIEFGSSRMLKLAKKSLDLEDARRNIKTAHKLGFITQGFFLMGHPEERAEDLAQTKSFIRSVPLDRILLSSPFPCPGSELFGYYLKNRYHDIKAIDWQTFEFVSYERILENMSDDYVRKERMKTNIGFYLNPWHMLRFLLKFRTWIQIKSAFYGFRFWCVLIFKNSKKR